MSTCFSSPSGKSLLPNFTNVDIVLHHSCVTNLMELDTENLNEFEILGGFASAVRNMRWRISSVSANANEMHYHTANADTNFISIPISCFLHLIIASNK